MEIAALWLTFSVVAGVIAAARGRWGFGYFLISIVLTPLVGLILAAALPAVRDEPVIDASGEVVSPKTHVRCPDCRELVRADARKCKHCGTALIPQKL